MPDRMQSNPRTFGRSGFQSAKRGTRIGAIKPKYLASARNAAHFRLSLRALAIHDGKDPHGAAVSLDRALAEPGHPDTAADLSGHDGINQDLRVAGEIAKPGGEIDRASDRGVVEPAFIADRSDRGRSHGDADAKTHGVAFVGPPLGERLHRRLQVDRKPHRAMRRVRTG